MAGIKRAKNDRKNRQNYTPRALLYTAGLIAAALAIIVLSSWLLPSFDPVLREPGPGRFFDRGRPAPNDADLPADVTNYFTIRLALSLVNVAAIAYLLFIHVKDYLRLRSSFTLGLIAFLFSFFLYAISTLPLMHIILGPYGRASMLSYVPMLFSAIGLLIFARLSSE